MCAWVWVWGRPRTGRVPSAGTQEIHPSPALKDPTGEMCAGENTQAGKTVELHLFISHSGVEIGHRTALLLLRAAAPTQRGLRTPLLSLPCCRKGKVLTSRFSYV